MDKFLLKSSLAVIAVMLYILCGPTVETGFDHEDGVPESLIIISTALADVSQTDMAAVRKEVQTALHSVLPVLGINNRGRTEIKIVDSGICNATGGVISLPILHIRDRSAAVIHEITHTVARHGDNSFFSEGLAVYFQDRFGDAAGFPNYSVPLDDLVRNNKEHLQSITGLMDDNEIFSRVGTEERRIAYIEAGSFIGFLVAQYGEGKLADLHNSRLLDYKKVYGKNINALESEWRSRVLAMQ
jgi:hypothetical protein